MANKANKNSGLKPTIQKAKAKFFSKRYDRTLKDLGIIAVTGAHGRDTVAHYLQEIIKTRDQKVGLIIDPASTSSLYKQLVKHWQNGADHVIIAATAQSIAEHMFYRLPFFSIVITNTKEEPIDENIRSILFNKEPYYAILNRDDQNYLSLADIPSKTATLSYGHSSEADLKINRSKLYKMGTEANFSYKNERFDIATYVAKEESVEYMAAAALTALSLGLSSDTIVDGVADYEPVIPVATPEY